MELRQLEHFLAVAEERHFTRAAESLDISQSGLSASIRSLESELGAALFTHSTRRVELTEAGRALLSESLRTVASAAAARDAVAAIRDVVRGTLSLGTEQCLGGVDLPLELARFRTDHPGVEVRLRYAGSADLLEQLAAGRMDLALIAAGFPVPQGVSVSVLSREPFVVLCPPDHPFAGRASLGLREVGRESQVGFAPDWAAHALVTRAVTALGERYRPAMQVGDVGSLLDLVGYGLGVAIVPEHFRLKRPDRLVAVPLDSSLEWAVALATPETLSPAARLLLARLR